MKSLGAKFVKVDLGETGQTAQGYAKELTPEQLEKQRDVMARVRAGRCRDHHRASLRPQGAAHRHHCDGRGDEARQRGRGHGGGERRQRRMLAAGEEVTVNGVHVLGHAICPAASRALRARCMRTTS